MRLEVVPKNSRPSGVTSMEMTTPPSVGANEVADPDGGVSSAAPGGPPPDDTEAAAGIHLGPVVGKGQRADGPVGIGDERRVHRAGGLGDRGQPGDGQPADPTEVATDVEPVAESAASARTAFVFAVVFQPGTRAPVSGVTAAIRGWLVPPTVVNAPPRKTLLPSDDAANA